MKWCYHPAYETPLGPGHPYPMSKYPLLMERLLGEGVLTAEFGLEPEPIPLECAARVHTADYLEKLSNSKLTVAEVRRLGLPWTETLWLRSRLAAGGTLLAARASLESGMAANLAGGTHHAFRGHGEGFCVLNDVAIAIEQLRVEGEIGRALVVDLDVHQGNGTAEIFAADNSVFTFSMHGEKNYPLAKMHSTLDIALADGTCDEEYLDSLAQHLPVVLDAAKADIALYVAGVDVVAGDRYGRLALSEQGLCAREKMVIKAVRSAGIPLVIMPAGGYASTAARTAELHAHVFREAVAYERRPGCALRLE